MKVAELCAGVGGLHKSMRLAGWPVDLAWVAEVDPDASKVLAAHHPDVPNVGDITTADFSALEPVDVIAAGFPCQDVSAAGRRAGLTPETRTGIWSHVARAINVIRPPLVLLENVRGLLSARAHSDVEPCPWCLGDEPDQLALRALGAVLGDLAELGYDAVWQSVPAAAIGAPHLRWRVFVVAYPAHADRDRREGRLNETDSRWRQPDFARRGTADPDGARHGTGGATAADLSLLPTPAARLGGRWGQPNADTAHRRMYEEGRRNLEDAVALLPTAKSSDADRRDCPSERQRRSPSLVSIDSLLPTPAARDAGRGGGYTNQPGRPLSETILRVPPFVPSVARGVGSSTPRATDGTKGGPNQRGSSGDLMLPSAVMQLLPTPTATPDGAAVRPSLDASARDLLLPTPTVADSRGSRNATAERTNPLPTTTTTSWTLADVAYADRWGEYGPAVARWELVMGRSAPDPTEAGRNGQPRLSARFVEWMQGYDDGYVTDVVSRNAALRILGNCVVPQQGAEAVRLLTPYLSAFQMIEVAA